jgi:hypothetical protein
MWPVRAIVHSRESHRGQGQGGRRPRESHCGRGQGVRRPRESHCVGSVQCDVAARHRSLAVGNLRAETGGAATIARRIPRRTHGPPESRPLHGPLQPNDRAHAAAQRSFRGRTLLGPRSLQARQRQSRTLSRGSAARCGGSLPRGLSATGRYTRAHEFTILLEDIGAERGATAFAERILAALRSSPLTVAGREMYASASIGIAITQTGYDSPDDVLRDADIAMYRAKELGKQRAMNFLLRNC